LDFILSPSNLGVLYSTAVIHVKDDPTFGRDVRTSGVFLIQRLSKTVQRSYFALKVSICNYWQCGLLNVLESMTSATGKRHSPGYPLLH
jgi:hypothetical protein